MTSIQPELWVDRAATAVAFYESAFGARVRHCVGEGEDIVAQLAVGEAAFWVAATGASATRLTPRLLGGPVVGKFQRTAGGAERRCGRRRVDGVTSLGGPIGIFRWPTASLPTEQSAGPSLSTTWAEVAQIFAARSSVVLSITNGDEFRFVSWSGNGFDALCSAASDHWYPSEQDPFDRAAPAGPPKGGLPTTDTVMVSLTQASQPPSRRHAAQSRGCSAFRRRFRLRDVAGGATNPILSPVAPVWAQARRCCSVRRTGPRCSLGPLRVRDELVWIVSGGDGSEM